jgi:hypothetical protein
MFTEPCILAWFSMSEKFLGATRSYRYNPRALIGARPFRGSSAVEQSAVNRSVVGSNPTPGATSPTYRRYVARAAESRPAAAAFALHLGPKQLAARQTLTGGRNLRQNQERRTLSGRSPTISGPAGRPARYTVRVDWHGCTQDEEALLDDMPRPRAIDDLLPALGSSAARGKLRRPLFVAALVGSLIGCTSADQPIPANPPQKIALVPPPGAAEQRPPVPKRKPATPASQVAATGTDPAGTDPAGFEPAAPAEVTTANLETIPSTPDKPMDVPPDLIGMESNAIEQSMGQPESRRDVPPAVVWRYANDACGLDVWLYRDLQSGALRALFVEVKGDDRTDQRRQFCIKQLALQSTGGAHRPDAEPASAR